MWMGKKNFFKTSFFVYLSDRSHSEKEFDLHCSSKENRRNEQNKED